MEKRLQQAMLAVEFKPEECNELQDKQLCRILSQVPQQRTKEQLAYIMRYVRRLTLFRQLMLAKPHKYKEVIAALSPYWEARTFHVGDTITITGSLSKYLNVLVQGKVHLFVPKSEQSYLNSVKQRNTKKRRNLSEFIHKKEELPPINRHLTIEETTKILKERGLVNDLLNPHAYLQILEDSLKVGSQPLRWTCKEKYDDCTAICAEPCVCLAIRWEVYAEIVAYREYIKKRTNIRLLLEFFKDLKYEDVIKYTNGSSTTLYEDKEDIVVKRGELYLVAEGEVVATMIPEQEEREEEIQLMVAPASRRQKPVCRCYQGQLIGGEELPQLRFLSHERTKILRLDPHLLRKDMQEHPSLALHIRQIIDTRREFLTKSISLCQNAAKQLSIQKRMQEVHVTERRNVADLSVMEALKSQPKNGVSYKQFIESCQITRVEGEVSIAIQHGKSKSKHVRCRRLADTESEREIFLKLGFLNQEQITRHNSELLRRRVSNGNLEELKGLVAPLGGRGKSVALEPPSFPSVHLFSKRCSLRLKCIS